MCPSAKKHEESNPKGRSASGLYIVQGVNSHANSSRICVVTTQKDRSGCGACRMATVYSTLNKNAPGTGAFLFLYMIMLWER